MINSDPDQEKIIFTYTSIQSNFSDSRKIKEWIEAAITEEGKKLQTLNYIFCDDQYLLEINKKYLDHDDYTDIITFPYSYDPISSDIFISIERVEENAKIFKKDYLNELKRVMIHGVLHLCGYGDKTKSEKQKMRAKEDYYIDKNQM